jgi:RHS repeat-associated protein
LVYFHCNHQYSVTAITTSTGAIAERYAYSAYGQPTILDPSGVTLPTSNFSIRTSYTGREWDATLGLHHFRARWMSGLTGRFLSRDPMGYIDGFGLYTSFVCIGRLDASETKTNLDICNEVKAGFESNLPHDFEKKCGKGKGGYYYYNLKITCEADSEGGDCKKTGSAGLTWCVHNRLSNNVLNIKICADAAFGTEQQIRDEFREILNHEVIHAMDFCTCDNNCDGSMPPPKGSGPKEKNRFCEHMACTEIRAYSFMECRNVPAADFEKCVIDKAKARLPKICDPKIVENLFGTCAIKQVHPAFPWVMVQLQGKGTLSNARQRALSTYPRTDLPLDRLRCQIGHSSRRDPSERRASTWYKVLLPRVPERACLLRSCRGASMAASGLVPIQDNPHWPCSPSGLSRAWSQDRDCTMGSAAQSIHDHV